MTGSLPPAHGTEAARAPLRRALIALCVTEITSWGVLYYAFPVMLSSMTRDTAWSTATAMAAFSTVSLAAGFASTVFAPLTATLLDHLSWRGTYLALAAVLAVVTIPLHALCLTPPWPGRGGGGDSRRRDEHARWPPSRSACAAPARCSDGSATPGWSPASARGRVRPSFWSAAPSPSSSSASCPAPTSPWSVSPSSRVPPAAGAAGHGR